MGGGGQRVVDRCQRPTKQRADVLCGIKHRMDDALTSKSCAASDLFARERVARIHRRANRRWGVWTVEGMDSLPVLTVRQVLRR